MDNKPFDYAKEITLAVINKSTDKLGIVLSSDAILIFFEKVYKKLKELETT